MSFIPGNHLVLSTGRVSVANVMRYAHELAKNAAAAYRAFQLRQAHKPSSVRGDDISYAWHFADSLKKSWTRAHQMQRLAVA